MKQFHSIAIPFSSKSFVLEIMLASAMLLGATCLPSMANADVPGITSGPQLQAEAEKHTKIITTEELKKALDSDPNMILVDIRTPSEINILGGSIKAPQNINIPRGWLEYRIVKKALSKDTPIVVYCGAGYRSPLAADTLQKMGYTHVRNYSAGFMGWKEAKLPIKLF